jgi:ABC-type histidine transport system ATPase subunit
MAKKAVASFGAKGSGKNFVKCIRMVRSERSGSYAFQEEMVPVEGEKDFFSKK